MDAIDVAIQSDFEAVGQPITFKIFSGLLKATRDADGKMRLRGVASSTIKDRHGDTMLRTALEDMERAAADNLTIFLNHSYDVPEDVAGSVETASMIERGLDGNSNPLWDLDFGIVVNETNDRAVKAWEAIDSGTKLGLSIGAMIPDGGAVRNKKTGAYTFSHVDLLETSIVGIPANPRSWVANAVKALKAASTTSNLGSPTLTLDGDRYRIEGSLEDAQISLGTSTIEVTDAVCGAPCEGGHCKKSKGHDGGHSSNADQNNLQSVEPEADSLDPTETPGIDAPEVQDAKIQVITIDTGSEESGDSQEAPASEPETESDSDDEYASVSEADTLSASLTTLSAAVEAMAQMRVQLTAADEARDAAIAERDEVIELTNKALLETSQIVEKLANMPVGRKAVIREAREDLASLERIYSPAIMKLMRGDNT